MSGELRPTPERLAQIRRWFGVGDSAFAELFAEMDALSAELAAVTAQMAAIRELVGGLDGESTLDAVRDMHLEWEHYAKEMNHAGYVTIPNLTRERDEARAQAEAVTAQRDALMEAATQAIERYEQWMRPSMFPGAAVAHIVEPLCAALVAPAPSTAEE